MAPTIARVPSVSRFRAMTNAELHRWVDALVHAYESGSPDTREIVLDEAERLRDELLRRLPGGDDPSGGVREPRRPLVDGGAAEAAVDPDDD